MSQLKKCLLGLATVSLTLSAQAMPVDASVGRFQGQGLQLTPIAEGLFETGVPSFLQSAWDNTYIVVGEIAKTGELLTGTAFPVMKKRIGKTNYVMFLTAGHVGDPVSELDLEGRDQLMIAQNGKITVTSQGGIPSMSGGLKYGTLDFFMNDDLDAAAILASVPDDQFAAITPMHFPVAGCTAAAGDKNYVIGFPAVDGRPIANQKVKITNPNVTDKRWSQGFITNDLGYDSTQADASTRISLIGTTADGLEGNSGSPAFDAQGNLIGMENAGADDRQYSGDESSTPMKAYSYLAPCKDLQSFMFSSWVKFTH